MKAFHFFRKSLLLLSLPLALGGAVAYFASKRPQPIPLDHAPMKPIAISSDGRFVATTKGGQVDIIAVYDRNRHQTTQFRTSDIPNNWIFLPDNHTLVTAGTSNLQSDMSGSGTVRLWNATTNTENLDQATPTRVFGPEIPQGMGLALSPDGKTLATGSTKGNLLLWNLQTGRVARSIGSHYGSPVALSFSQNGRLLAAGFDSAPNAMLFDVSTGKTLWTMNVPPNQSFGVTSSALSPDGKVMALGSYGGKVAFLDARTGHLIKVSSTPATPNNGGSPVDAARAVAFSPDGTRLVSGGWGEAVLWNVATGESQIISGSGPAVFGPDGLVTGAEMNSPNGVIIWKSIH